MGHHDDSAEKQEEADLHKQMLEQKKRLDEQRKKALERSLAAQRRALGAGDDGGIKGNSGSTLG